MQIKGNDTIFDIESLINKDNRFSKYQMYNDIQEIREVVSKRRQILSVSENTYKTINDNTKAELNGITIH